MSEQTGMSEGWHIRGGEGAEEWQTGPFTWEQLLGFVPQGRLVPENLVWHPSMTQWVAARDVVGLFPYDVADAAAPVDAAATAPAAAAAPGAPAAAAQPAPKRKTGLAIAAVAVAAILIVAGIGFGAWALLGGLGGFGSGGPGGDGPDLGAASHTVPDPASLIETERWGEVPANQVGLLMREGAGRKDAEKVAEALGGSVVGEVEFIGVYQVAYPGTTEADLAAAIDAASAHDSVEGAFPNEQVELDVEIWGERVDPYEDPVYSGEPGDGYRAIGVSKAWEYIRGSGIELSPVRVGVTDDGLFRPGEGREHEFGGDVRIAFPDEAAGELSAPSTNNQGVPFQYGSHGTGVATIIGADPDNGGPAGIAGPLGDNLTVAMTNTFASTYGYSQESPDPDDPTRMVWTDGTTYSIGNLVALRDQIRDGATIINMSWGASNADEVTTAAYQRFFTQMAEEHPDVLFVCSAGNTGEPLDGSRRFPSGMSLPNMITVGALDNDGATATYSSRANSDYEVTLAAPGTQAIVGLNPQGGVFRANGTSFSAPKVAAAAAVLRSINPDLEAGDIKRILVETARPGVATRSDAPDATSNLIGQEVGGRILALDIAVLKVINDMRADRDLPPLDEEQLEALGVIDAVAVGSDDSTEFTVRGIVKGIGEKGTDVKIDVWSTNSAISGSTTQRLDAPGEVEWGVYLPSGEGAIRVMRLDNRAASIITIEHIDINGSWSGTFTITEIEITDEEAASEEGCSIVLADALKGIPLPMTMDILVDATGQGTASMFVDISAAIEDASSEPQGFRVSQSGSSVTFEPTDGGSPMHATVSKEGGSLVMKGTASDSGEGWRMSAVFTLTKPE